MVAARPAHNRLIVREGGEPLPQDEQERAYKQYQDRWDDRVTIPGTLKIDKCQLQAREKQIVLLIEGGGNGG
jgi:hypothetical protein